MSKALSQKRSVLPDNWSICQVDKKVAKASMFSEADPDKEMEHIQDGKLAKWQS